MDKIIRTLAFGGNVQVTALQTTELVNKAIEIHGTMPEVSEILGGFLTCAAYIASGIKSETGAVSITVKGKGGGAVSVSSDALLHVRGYADDSFPQGIKGGSLTVVREDGYSARPFVGALEPESDNVSEVFAQYYQQSEQIPTAVCVRADCKNGACGFAGGLIIQLMPDAAEEAISRAEEAFSAYCSVGGEASADEILGRFFGDETCGERTESYPVYACNCSEGKIKGVLASVGRSELLKICEEQGSVKVHCHYCNKDYTFVKKQIEEMFDK